jgi:hypothetical protein
MTYEFDIYRFWFRLCCAPAHSICSRMAWVQNQITTAAIATSVQSVNHIDAEGAEWLSYLTLTAVHHCIGR